MFPSVYDIENIFAISNQGALFNTFIYDEYNYRPVMYLSSDAQFNGIGDGSSTNPYQLKID